MKKLLCKTVYLSVILTLLSVNYSYAQDTNSSISPIREATLNKEKSCLSFGIIALPFSETYCFEGPAFYVDHGTWTLQLSYGNNHDKNLFIFGKSPLDQKSGLIVDHVFLQGSTWLRPDNYSFVGDEQKIRGFQVTQNGEVYGAREIPAKSTEVIVQNKEGTALSLKSIPNTADRNKPALQITFKTQGYLGKQNTDKDGITRWYPDLKSKPITMVNHLFIYATWCGDGVVQDKYGELFDDGINNGKRGFASLDCQSKVQE